MALVLNDHATAHSFQKSKNEVAFLYQRMKGLVVTKFKKDCLDLPDKVFKQIRLIPSQSVLNVAKVIQNTAKNTISALTLLRELSDGFQYQDVSSGGYHHCPRCHGLKQVIEKRVNELEEYVDEEVDCPYCGGEGIVPSFVRNSVQVPCPKEDALVSLLDEYSEVGRVVVYAGFTGSVDRCVNICKKEKWQVIRVDGRGWEGFGLWPNPTEMLKAFQYGKEDHIAFVAQPSSAGMGLTLTASPMIVYYSNDFNGEARIQSSDRIHRIGMDTNRGATIYDLLHLPVDDLILESHNKKQKLQDISMGQMKDEMGKIYTERQL
jgi:SNF2 family DNA or RNA helicase